MTEHLGSATDSESPTPPVTKPTNTPEPEDWISDRELLFAIGMGLFLVLFLALTVGYIAWEVISGF